jgi:ADP-ribose pyrophosphatase YjhB (NUDIX family)
LEFGETIDECLRKEIKEELCADVVNAEFLGVMDVFRTQHEKPTHWISLHFKVLVDPKQVKNGEPHKFDEIAWFKLDQLPPKEELHSQLPKAIERYKEKL